MTSDGHYVGVDGCRGGWVAVTLEGEDPLRVEAFTSLANLWRAHSRAEAILIDMPIGLWGCAPGDIGRPGSRRAETGEVAPYAQERECDKVARRLLNWGLLDEGKREGTPCSGRGCTVFPVPCREAVWAITEEQATTNERLTGRKLPRQSAAILLKMRELDDLLRRCRHARRVFRESHPELLFCALNEGRAVAVNKKRRAGRDRRVDLLSKVVWRENVERALGSRAFLDPRPARDDILDALACAVAACHPDELVSIPSHPPLDEYGLPMQMVHWRPGADKKHLD